MRRHSALGTRLSAVLLAVALAGCGSAKAKEDSVAAAARRDTFAAESARIAREGLAKAESIAKASSKKSGGAKTTSTTTNEKTGGANILGRDSVRQGPIIGLPSIKDTAKKKPPL